MGGGGRWSSVDVGRVAAVGVAVSLVAASTLVSPAARVSADPPERSSAGVVEALAAERTVSFDGGDVQAVVPVRVLDTRIGLGAPVGKLGPDSALTLQVAGRGGVPAVGVGAVVLNVAVTEPTASSFLTVFPTGDARPTAASLNFVAGQTVPNLVVVKVGVGGSVEVYNRFGAAHIVADVTGWFPEGSGLQPMTPIRLLDTREGLGAPDRPVGPDGVLRLQVAGKAGIPVGAAGAVVLNVTATAGTAQSFVTAYPTGSPRPTAASLNFAAGQTFPNLVVVKLGTGGSVDLFNRFGSVELVADVVGWFSTTSALTAINPTRFLDTRLGLGAPQRPVGQQSVTNLKIAGRHGLPASGVGAVVVNVTATQPTQQSYITVYPNGADRPTAANLNFVPGLTIPNLVIVKVGADGSINLFNRFGDVHLVADVVGWFPTGGDSTVSMTLQPGTVLYGAGDVISTTGNAQTGGSLLLSASADRPAVGGQVAVFPTPAVPAGFAGEVTKVTAGANGTARVTVVAADLDELFSDLEIGADGWKESPDAVPGRLVEGFDSCTAAVPGGVTSFGASIDNLGGEFDFSLRRKTARLLVTATVNVEVGVDIGTGISCSIPVAKLFGLIGVTTIEFDGSVDVSLTAALEGSVTGSAEIALGFSYRNGVVTNLSDFDLSGSADFEPFSATLGLGLGFDGATKLFGVAGVGLSHGPTLNATVTPDCVELTGTYDASISAEVGRWGVGWEFQIAGFSLGPWTLYQSPACRPKVWTGTLSTSIDHTVRIGDAVNWQQFVIDENASYQLRLPSSDRTVLDGSGVYPARIAGSGLETRTWPECELPNTGDPLREIAWDYTPIVREQAMEFEYDDAADQWMWGPKTASRTVLVQGDTGTGQATETLHCAFSPPDVYEFSGAVEYFTLGWGGAVTGSSFGVAPLNDTNPAADRLVGTTTWTIADPPPMGLFGADTKAYTFTAVYDLTLVPRP